MIALLKYSFTFALFVICAIVSLFYCYFTLAVHTDWLALVHDPSSIDNGQVIALSLLVGLPIVFFILFSPLLSLKPTRWYGGVIRFLLVVAMLGFIGYQFFDERKVYQLYSEKDLRVNHPENASAAFLLAPILEQSSRPIPDASAFVGGEFFRNILVHRQDIEQAWKSITNYRTSFDQLADLEVLPQPFRSGEGPGPDYSALMNIMRIYAAYSLLQVELGNREAGIGYLSTSHRVARHGLAGSCYLKDKQLWAEALRTNIAAAYRIAEQPATTYEEVAQLIETFSSLKIDEVSLHRVLLARYLQAREALNDPPETVLDEYLASVDSQPLLLQVVPPWLFAAAYRLTYQKNRSTRVLQAFWKPIIKRSKTQLAILSEMGGTLAAYGQNPPLQNLSGWYFHQPRPDPELEQEMVQLQGASDLLSAYMNDKVEFGRGLEEYLSGDYGQIIADGAVITAAGADGTFATADDITLQPLY